jgi:hypothetical protein
MDVIYRSHTFVISDCFYYNFQKSFSSILLISNNANENGFRARGSESDTRVAARPQSAHTSGVQRFRAMPLLGGCKTTPDCGLVHHVAGTAANIHDLTPVNELRHGQESQVQTVADYQGIDKREELKHHLAQWQVTLRNRQTPVIARSPNGETTQTSSRP